MGGRRIDDHSSWIGQGAVPMQSKVKEISEGESAGALKDYQDTSEKIYDAQKGAVKKIHEQNQPAQERY